MLLRFVEITVSPDYLGEAFNDADFCLTFKYIMLYCQVVRVLITRGVQFFSQYFFVWVYWAPQKLGFLKKTGSQYW